MTAFSGSIERELGGDLIVNLTADGVAFRRKGQRRGLSLRVAWADIEALSSGVAPAQAAPATEQAAPLGEWHCPKCGFANNLGPGPWACPDCEAAGDATELVEGPPRLQASLPGVDAPPATGPAQPALSTLPPAQIAAPTPEGRKRRSKCPRCGELGFFTKGHAHAKEDGTTCVLT